MHTHTTFRFTHTLKGADASRIPVIRYLPHGCLMPHTHASHISHADASRISVIRDLTHACLTHVAYASVELIGRCVRVCDMLRIDAYAYAIDAYAYAMCCASHGSAQI